MQNIARKIEIAERMDDLVGLGISPLQLRAEKKLELQKTFSFLCWLIAFEALLFYLVL